MIDVLLVTVAPIPVELLLAVARRLHGPDVRLRWATSSVADLPDSPLFTEWHSFAQEPSTLGRRTAKAAEEAPPSKRAWMHGQRDSWLQARAGKANVIVALDSQAVYTVWQLAQVNAGAHACYGAAAAVHAVADRRKRPAHYAWTDLVSLLPSPRSLTRAAARRARSLLKAVALRATGPSMLRTGPGAAIWRAVATAPGLPTKARSRMAMRVADSLQKVDLRPRQCSRSPRRGPDPWTLPARGPCHQSRAAGTR